MDDAIRKCHACGDMAVNEVGAAIVDERDRYKAALERLTNPPLDPMAVEDIARRALRGEQGEP